MVRRRAKAAGITTEVCNHTFRGTGITAYLENGGTLEKARQMAAPCLHPHHPALRPARDCVTLDEVVKINTRGRPFHDRSTPNKRTKSLRRKSRQLCAIITHPRQCKCRFVRVS